MAVVVSGRVGSVLYFRSVAEVTAVAAAMKHSGVDSLKYSRDNVQSGLFIDTSKLLFSFFFNLNITTLIRY